MILNVKATGMDLEHDRIIEIGMLRIEGTEITKKYQCLVQSEKSIPDNIAKLTGITDELMERQGIREEEALEKVQEFVGNDLVIGYHIQSDADFIEKLSEQIGRNIVIKKTRDIMHIVKRKLDDDLENYELETVAAYFSIDVSNVHRALGCCMLMYGIYLELNKL